MSAPDGGIRHYAAGYEILADGHPRWWGQLAVSVGSGVGDKHQVPRLVVVRLELVGSGLADVQHLVLGLHDHRSVAVDEEMALSPADQL